MRKFNVNWVSLFFTTFLLLDPLSLKMHGVYINTSRPDCLQYFNKCSIIYFFSVLLLLSFCSFYIICLSHSLIRLLRPMLTLTINHMPHFYLSLLSIFFQHPIHLCHPIVCPFPSLFPFSPPSLNHTGCKVAWWLRAFALHVQAIRGSAVYLHF